MVCGVAITSPRSDLWEVGKKAAVALRTHGNAWMSARKPVLEPVPIGSTGFQYPRDLGKDLRGSTCCSSLHLLPAEEAVMKQH